jgi:hypothetical protein
VKVMERAGLLTVRLSVGTFIEPRVTGTKNYSFHCRFLEPQMEDGHEKGWKH